MRTRPNGGTLVLAALTLMTTASQAFMVPASTRRSTASRTVRRPAQKTIRARPHHHPNCRRPTTSRTRSITTTSLLQEAATTDNNNNKPNPGILEKFATIISQRYNAETASPAEIRSERDRRRVSLLTLLRVSIPSLVAGTAATLLFPALAIGLATAFNDPGVFAVLSQDSSQFVQNFLTVAGLLFSILVGQTCECGSRRTVLPLRVLLGILCGTPDLSHTLSPSLFLLLLVWQTTFSTHSKRVSTTLSFRKSPRQNRCSNRSPWSVRAAPCTLAVSKAFPNTCRAT